LSGKEHIYFELLKKKIIVVMQKSYPGMNPSITEWKGQEITDFQEDLRIKMNAHISEKWFYTHMKTARASLPRIDMLNLLSRYAGYQNWDDFVFKNRGTVPAVRSTDHPNIYFILVPVLTLLVVAILYGAFKLFNTQKYHFCFIDADTREPITGSRIEIKLLLEGESPVQYLCNAEGCFTLETDKSKIRMLVSSPYYETDTVVRILKKLNRHEVIALRANDYALMIHYFSTMKVDDWEKRRYRLNDMIDDSAMICQVIGSKGIMGMALYNKKEFINKLTMPTGSLRNIEILGTRLRNNKIILLRFLINEKKR